MASVLEIELNSLEYTVPTPAKYKEKRIRWGPYSILILISYPSIFWRKRNLELIVRRFHLVMRKKESSLRWPAKRPLLLILPTLLHLLSLVIRKSKKEFSVNSLEEPKRTVKDNLREGLGQISMFAYLEILLLLSLNFFSKSIKLHPEVYSQMEGVLQLLVWLPMYEKTPKLTNSF